MDQLQHDPRTKSQIKDALWKFIYAPVIKSFQSRLETLIDRNCLLCGYSHRSFTYKGKNYTVDTTPLPLKRNRLHASLRPDMDSYLEEQEELNNNEVHYVLGFINAVLNSSNNIPDYFKLLPDAVHKPVADFVATCPCHTPGLPADRIQKILERNQESIALMKRRILLNLLNHP